jgi:hypothetical protein
MNYMLMNECYMLYVIQNHICFFMNLLFCWCLCMNLNVLLSTILLVYDYDECYMNDDVYVNE